MRSCLLAVAVRVALLESTGDVFFSLSQIPSNHNDLEVLIVDS